MRAKLVVSIVAMAILFGVSGPLEAALLNSQGRLTMLRVHDVGTKYGPPSDQIDVEVVIQLDSRPGMAFGFQLRGGTNALAHQGMLDLLRDAFENRWVVNIDYSLDQGKKNGVIIRTWVKK
jgi:hypothetical protein